MKVGQEAWQLGAKGGGNFLGKYGAEAFTEEEINAIVNQMDDLVVTAKRVVPIKQYVQFTSKLGRSKAGQRVFSYQARFSKSNLNIRLDRGFRAPFKNATSNYLGKPYNGFNTHINIQKPGIFNYHFPLNPLKWKYYTIP